MNDIGPTALRAEHEILKEQMAYALSRTGDVGKMAKELEAAMKPHMAREETEVMVILEAAEDLAAGHWPANAELLLERFLALEADLRMMWKEHDQIHTLVRKLRRVADIEGEEEIVRLCDALIQHADLEEQVLYPAAIIAGRYLRLWAQERETHHAAAD
jgi:hypothetical protein